MNNPEIIKSLINTNQKQVDKLAIQLGIANTNKTKAQQSLVMLENYYNEYVTRLQTHQIQGISVGDHNNFQQFMITLNQTINQQKQILHNCIQVIEKCVADVRSCENKTLSYNILHKQLEKKLQNEENKREQKMTDEYASRSKLKY